ncbi:hypothetical protein ACO2Q0_09250 [Phenylobacterium sp. VNQ135]|uniref:hypothetical protein n=1 Tax=Phenylobacterium sp. VNQ135 TaxID=3400922 RepID=UPI003C0FBA26
MSEPSNPNSAGGVGGPISRPHGEGLPPKTGGGDVRDIGPGDSRDPGVDPGMAGDGDLGEDAAGGMIGEGDDGRDV